jgi:hypothetical protein
MTYTANELFRTAFNYMDLQLDCAFGRGLPHGINQVCVCCKAGSLDEAGATIGSVDRITDELELKPWSTFYKTKEYTAYVCRSCGYQWSWYRDKQQKETTE